ncbi:MAG: chorismate synthase [Candidatus Omnitrophica bacterium CG11_big_fil_rev_8_21_14_0_20_42_13]|uniref:Chorismate synthase n=1 Tax=Candidatus Ghiorseimicrobium undicola TaxID=1974746 RepID=A0A2H0LWR3_9BACT|nr:MAG: chorismate synthase [Candidatus Omnitrophica bacterium CG11_big_fil_rev_8_21_14_0_20_42_13]
MLRFLTAGESHGKGLVAILEGMVSGLNLDVKKIDLELIRRQGGAGRGGRMKIERDRAEILSGVKGNKTIGSPIAVLIKNKDYKIEKLPAVYSPRPGHADLAGVLKYGFDDIRCVLERASARETAARTAVGAICKMLLAEFKIKINSSICQIGGVYNYSDIKRKINEAKKNKDTLGGVFEVRAFNLPIGLGSYVHCDRRLDGRLSAAVMSIPAVKAVEIGLGFGYAGQFGSGVHDAIYYDKKHNFYRKTNNAGGLEGGVTNGQPLVIRACMKPISTVGNALPSVNMLNKKASKAAVERYDTCAVEACSVVAEAVIAFELANAFLEKFGSDSLKELSTNYSNYIKKDR